MPGRQPLPERMSSARTAVRVLALVVVAFNLPGCQTQRPTTLVEPLPTASDYRILEDHREMYTGKHLALLASGLGASAAIAHSDADRSLQDWYQSSVRSSGTQQFSRTTKPLGEGYVTVPLLAAGLLYGELRDDTPSGSAIGDWADRSLRSVLVGAPPLLLSQSMTGASRPEEQFGSAWRPFKDDNGASGHAFIGAFPLITAAQMSNNPYAKAAFYTASAVPAWSRVEDDAHFASQAFLGWWIAYVACTAVADSERHASDLHLAPVDIPGGVGIGVVWDH